MDGEEVGRFLDLLYETALDQSRWVPAMERLADLLGGSSCWLARLHVANGTGSGIISRIDPVMPAVYLADYASRNPFSNARDPEDHMRRWTPRIRFHDDFMPRDQVVRTAFYNDFLKPQNIVSTMMFGLSSGGFETCVLNVNHASASFDAQQVALADRLHPHLRRAFALSCALGDGDSRLGGPDALAALDGVGHGIVVVDAAGRVLHANAPASALTGAGEGLRVEDGVLSASDRA